MGDLALSYRPHPSLRGQVRRIAGFTEHASGPVHRGELPHAGIPIIISFGDRFRIDSSTSQGQHTSFLAGLHEIPVDTEHDSTMRCIQVDLTPPAAYQLLGLPISELTDPVVDLDLLGWAGLGDRLASAQGWSERFRLMEQALGHRLEDGRPTDPEVDWAWHALHRTIPVGRLATTDPDTVHKRAVAAGADIVMGLIDQEYGSREFAARDPEGNVWCFGTYQPSVKPG